MGITDIRLYKKQLRSKYRQLRTSMTPQEKRQKDDRIFQQIISSRYFQQAQTIFCFVSTKIEIDTHRLIVYALRHGKQVAVPKCLNDKGIMQFFYICSMQDLEIGKFSLLEPNPSICKKVSDYQNSICIVPGFSFDPHGFRLGYGKGYYDRFLSKYPFTKIGICYNNCVAPKLPHGRYDVPVNYLFTEKYIKKIQSPA